MMIKESENLIVEEHKHIVKIEKQEKKKKGLNNVRQLINERLNDVYFS